MPDKILDIRDKREDLENEQDLLALENGNISDRYLVFYLEEIEFAISLKYITEIVGVQKPTRVPKLPEYVDGIVNLRGQIVPIIDTRTKFGMERIPSTERTSVIVLEDDDIILGLVVDDVDEVVTMLPQSIKPPLVCKTGVESKYISGLGRLHNGKTVFILDGEEILRGEED